MTQQRLVIHIINKFSYIKGLEKMDLVQAGNFGLMEAIESYDLNKGVKFSSFAYIIIYTKMIDALNDQADLIKVSPYHKEKDKQHPKAYLSEIKNCSVHSDTSYSDFPSVNLDSPMKAYMTQERSNEIKQALSKLDPKSKQMVSMYFGLDGGKSHTYQEIGSIFSMSKVGAYKHIQKQLKKLSVILDY